MRGETDGYRAEEVDARRFEKAPQAWDVPGSMADRYSALRKLEPFASGIVAACVPLPFAVAGGLNADFGLASGPLLGIQGLRLGAATLASATLVSATASLLAGRSAARRLLLALVCTAVAASPGVTSEPASALAAFLVTVALITILGRAPGAPSTSADLLAPAGRSAGALMTAGIAWLTASWHQSESPFTQAGMLASAVLALVFALAWLSERTRRGASDRPASWRLAMAWLGAGAMLAVAGTLLPDTLGAAGFVLLAATITRFVVAVPAPLTQSDQDSWGAALVEHPARLLVATFLGLCAAGTLLLAWPAASSGRPVAIIDAAFTSVSATCVTGLIVVDTAHAFSGFGQLGVLLLIQTGGLGIMTFSTAALALLGRRPSIRHEGAVSELVGSEGRADLYAAVHRVLKFTFVTEGIGALSLTLAFLRHGDALWTAAWRGLFTAISAFCNAGFALQTDSLMPYQQDGFVLDVVGLMIILGGLGPLVVVALPRLLERRPTSAYVRLALLATIVLVVAPTLLIGALEWTHSLGHLSVGDKLQNAFFQSVTLRTAGFNSVDMAALVPATRMLMVGLMFIGGCPGSTAGGIKTTTAAMLVLAVFVALRRRTEVRIFGRRIAHSSLYRAAAIATLASCGALFALMGLLLTQRVDVGDAIFEVISALGTVGLSRGVTAQMDTVGKLILMMCMFAGRVGPLTLFMLLSERQAEPRTRLPVEEIAVG